MVKNLPCNSGDVGSALVGEDPTCPGATMSARSSYLSLSALEPARPNQGVSMPQQKILRDPTKIHVPLLKA